MKCFNMPVYHDFQYTDFLTTVHRKGRLKTDRTGTGTVSIFDYTMKFDISQNKIPMLTSKRIHQPSIIHEMLWYLKGETNTKYLVENGIRIWNEWADENGELGPIYGKQWRACPGKAIGIKDTLTEFETREDGENYLTFHGDAEYETIDQIAILIDQLKKNPDSRRHIVNAWNVGQLHDMKLPPCHAFFQFYVTNMNLNERWNWVIANDFSGKDELLTLLDSQQLKDEDLTKHNVPTQSLSCKLTQRSADVFLGVPFNIAQYSILTCLIAKIVGMAPNQFIWSGGDCHIYTNHFDQVREQLQRVPYESPTLKINPAVDNIDNLRYNDFEIVNYQSHPPIKAKVAV